MKSNTAHLPVCSPFDGARTLALPVPVKRAKTGPDRDVDKITKKLAVGRATTGTIEAVQEAVALLALAGRFEDALRILKPLAGSPKSVVRLVTDAWDTTYFRRRFHLLAAVTATPALRKKLAISTRDAIEDVRSERERHAQNRAHYRADPGSYYGADEPTTRALAAVLAHREADDQHSALAAARALVAMTTGHWTIKLEHLRLAAEMAFAAGEEAEAIAFTARAAAENREGSHGARWDELETLLETEASAHALARGAFRSVNLDDAGAAALVKAVEEFLGVVLEPSAGKAE